MKIQIENLLSDPKIYDLTALTTDDSIAILLSLEAPSTSQIFLANPIDLDRINTSKVKLLKDKIVKSVLERDGLDTTFISYLNLFRTRPVNFLQELRKISPHSHTAFYQKVLLAYCYQTGVGCQVMKEQARSHFEEAMAQSDTQPKIQFLQNLSKLIQTPPEVEMILDCKLKLLLVSQTLPHSGYLRALEEITHYLAKIKSLDITNKALLLCLSAMETDTKKLRISYKKSKFLAQLNKISLELSEEGLVDALNTLSKDEELLSYFANEPQEATAILEPVELWLKDDTQATWYYHRLYYLVTRSPQSALRLADMAANGENPEKQAQHAPVSDFETALSNYLNAITAAIGFCDFKLLLVAIEQYQTVHEQIRVDNRIDVSKKLQLALERYAELTTALSRSGLHEMPYVKAKRGKMSRTEFEQEFTKDLIKLLYLNNDIQGIKIVSGHFLSLGNTVLQWYEILSSLLRLKPNKSYDTIKTMVQGLFQPLTQYITQNPNNSSLLDGIVMDINVYSLSNGNTAALLQAIVRIYMNDFNTGLRQNSLEILTRLKSINCAIKEISNHDPLSNMVFWIERINMEKQLLDNSEAFKFDNKNELNEIYYYAQCYKKKINGYTHFYTANLTYLRCKYHAEAFLKIGELLLNELTDSNNLTTLVDIGSNLISAMACKHPKVDPNGYTILGYERLTEMMSRATTQNLGTVHFFHSLGLLILDPQKFHQEHHYLFEGTTQNSTVKLVLDLFKNPSLTFSNAVKQTVLSSIQSLGKSIDVKLYDEAVNLLRPILLAIEAEERVATPTPSGAQLTVVTVDAKKDEEQHPDAKESDTLQKRYEATCLKLQETEKELQQTKAALLDAQAKIAQFENTHHRYKTFFDKQPSTTELAQEGSSADDQKDLKM